jgi:glycosyl transferase, family 25
MIEKFGIEGTYIIHAKKGYEYHAARIERLFKSMDLNFEFVTDGDPTCFSDALLDTYFCKGIEHILQRGTLSCTLNHILSYEKIVSRKNKYALVFENDPFFTGNFTKEIEQIIAEADKLPKGFIISLENTTLQFPRYKKIKKGTLLYEATIGRCAGAYLLDLQAATNILTDLQTTKCEEVVDWWHNKLIKRKVVKMYWAYPALTEQGSHNGLLSSTISTKRKSTKRRIQWLAQKFYKTYITRWFK